MQKSYSSLDDFKVITFSILVHVLVSFLSMHIFTYEVHIS